MSLLQYITRTTTRYLLQAKSFQNIPNAKKPTCQFLYDKRQLWGYVAVAFNQVDTDRLSQVGPNRLCAEWILKNGGGVRFTENPTKLWKDYNSLPTESTRFRIKVVDASNSSIMRIGMNHFIGCTEIDTVILHNCKHLEENSLEGLVYLKESLERLQVSGCYNICDAGLLPLGELTNLKQLLIFDMIFVKDMNNVQEKLKSMLPNCTIEATTYAAKIK